MAFLLTVAIVRGLFVLVDTTATALAGGGSAKQVGGLRGKLAFWMIREFEVIRAFQSVLLTEPMH